MADPTLDDLYRLFGEFWAEIDTSPGARPDPKRIKERRKALGKAMVQASIWLLPAAKLSNGLIPKLGRLYREGFEDGLRWCGGDEFGPTPEIDEQRLSQAIERVINEQVPCSRP
jgi:hypothetical protein